MGARLRIFIATIFTSQQTLYFRLSVFADILDCNIINVNRRANNSHMSDFIEKLKLAEKAAEDIYFAKVNRELIDCLHNRMQAEKNPYQPCDQSSAEARAEDSPVGMKDTADR